MRRQLLKYGFLLGCFFSLTAQVVPWTVTPTTNSGVVRLFTPDSSMWYDGALAEQGDALGLFFDQGGTWVCGGYIQFDGVSTAFTVYGNDAVDNGFQEGEWYHFRYWRKSKNCVIDNPFGAMINAQYATGGADTVMSVSANPIVVAYPKSYYCLNNTSVLPISPSISGTLISNLSFEINPWATDFNMATGVLSSYADMISLDYVIGVDVLDNTCIRNDLITIHFSEKLDNPMNPIVSQPQSCTEKGLVKLDTALLTNGTRPLSFELFSLPDYTPTNSANGGFEEVKAGSYELVVKDLHGCSDTAQVAVQPAPECETDIVILTPQMSSGNTEVLLNYEGQIKIYNSQGELIHSMTGPAVWKGQDKNGNMVKTGAYYIFSKEIKQQEITVIY